MLLQQLDTGFTNQHVGATSAQILETDVATARAVTKTGSPLRGYAMRKELIL